MVFSIKDQMKRSFQRFCEGTSFHGYIELIQAKAKFWALFWILTCGIAIGLTVQLMYGSITQYLYSSTDTVISTADENQILYPPLYLCFQHWFQWVDFSKVVNLRYYDKATSLNALNYFSPIFSQQETYDPEDSYAKLNQLLINNNFSTLLQFYNYIARPPPIVATTNLAENFDQRDIIFKNSVFLYCYVMSSQSVYKYITENIVDNNTGIQRKLISFSVITENYNFSKNHLDLFVTETEYESYMLQWIIGNTDYVTKNSSKIDNLNGFSPPIKLIPNGFDNSVVTILPEMEEYFVNFRIMTRQWLSDPDQYCDMNSQSIASNETCELVCLAQTQNKTCTCMDLHMAALLKVDYPENVCRFGFYLINDKGDVISEVAFKAENKTQVNQQCSENVRQNVDFQNCFNSCVISCNIWNYEMSLIATHMSQAAQKLYQKNITDINVQYPMASDILVMTEEIGQSWETFVANVGGVMGVWTGASIVSLIQLVYLCCCYEIDHLPRWMHINKGRRIAATESHKRRTVIVSENQNETNFNKRTMIRKVTRSSSL